MQSSTHTDWLLGPGLVVHGVESLTSASQICRPNTCCESKYGQPSCSDEAEAKKAAPSGPTTRPPAQCAEVHVAAVLPPPFSPATPRAAIVGVLHRSTATTLLAATEAQLLPGHHWPALTTLASSPPSRGRCPPALAKSATTTTNSIPGTLIGMSGVSMVNTSSPE